MTDLDRAIYRACAKADTAYQNAGETGTKTWIQDYFLPALADEGLVITLERAKEAPRG